MNNPQKRWLTSGLLALTLFGGTFMAQRAFAEDTGSPMDSLVAKIASRFNLSESEVQQAFDEHRDEQRAAREQDYTDRLSQAVTDGELTQEQKDKLIAKHDEIQQKMEEARSSGSTPKAEMRSLRTELDEWAQQNGIDPKWLMPRNGRGGKGAMGGGRMMGWNQPSADTGTSGTATN